MSKVIFALLMLFGINAFAQSEDIRLGEDKVNDYFIKYDSFVAQKDTSGIDFIAATLKTVEKRTYNIFFSHYVMAENTCTKGYGKMIAIDRKGEVEAIEDITIDGKDKMDVLASAICFMNTVNKKKKLEKMSFKFNSALI